MRARNWISVAAVLVASAAIAFAQTEAPGQLVREVVYNELHDHQQHGYWRYWVERQDRLSEQIETAEGPVSRQIAVDGRSLAGEVEQRESARLEQMLASPAERARRRQEYAEDEKRIGRIVALLPEAFVYEYAGEENGCYKLHFRPNPAYPPHGVEARIFHAMNGELWVDARYKRMVRLDGTLAENVDFGFGLLGRLYRGGWFRLERTRVSATDWKTARLEVHMSGRALLFKTIARETSETRGGFSSVPAGLTLEQGIRLLTAEPGQTAHAETAGQALRAGAAGGVRH